MHKILVVGMGCVYSESQDLKNFWETILTQRCGFRTFPPQRLPLAEYGSTSKDDRDKTYIQRAALIHGFNFDWKRNRIPKATFDVTDPTHWLALNTAIAALEDASVDLDAVGRERIGVIIGNSLTGEVSRAQMLRLRWPYVRSAIITGARRAGIEDASLLTKLVTEAEHSFKSAFPIPNEDTLAGALANVIAGRICNMLDLNGGGYIVDGACASSLLAISTACEALESNRLDMAIAGGVDISLDPLEMVGFARTGALTTGTMRVYDRNATGFLPGEGCGMVVLMREADAIHHGLHPWARIAGWGISSDGAGGITAPKAHAQYLAMQRCYERCAFPATTLDFIEGHGTGTPVGDNQELLGFIEATQGETDSPPDLRRTGVTSVKTLIGHTKAAAGAAGFIKTVLAVNQRVLPPLASLDTPAANFSQPNNLYPLAQGRTLPPTTELRAGVSGAGFGGINCHIAVTGAGIPPRKLATRNSDFLMASAQRAELFISSATDLAELANQLSTLLSHAQGLAEAELVDLAAWWAFKDSSAPMRAAVVASTVAELHTRLTALLTALKSGDHAQATLPFGTLVARATPGLRIGYLLPGQGAQFIGMGSRLPNRSGWAAVRRARWDQQFADLGSRGLTGFSAPPLERAATPAVLAQWENALRNTQVAQPAIVLTALQWVQWLSQVGIIPQVIAGHSLGEIPALVTAGMLSEVEAITIIRTRAAECARTDLPPGSMLAIQCGIQLAETLVAKVASYAVVANDNAPDQVVISGTPEAITEIQQLAQARGITATVLKVSQAFHSRHMAAAEAALGRIAKVCGEIRSARIPFISGVYGGLAPSEFDPFAYLAAQITAPVRFREVLTTIAQSCDICIEIGPGSILTGLARRTLGAALPVCALEPGPGNTDAALCLTIGELFVRGAQLDWQILYADRYWRPFVPAAERAFIINPCIHLHNSSLLESITGAATSLIPKEAVSTPLQTPTISTELLDSPAAAEDSIANLMRRLIATESGYDLETIPLNVNLSRDLRLDSIKVAEIRAKLRAHHIEFPDGFPFATAPLWELARVAILKPTAPASLPGTHADKGLQPLPAMPKDLPVLGYSYTWRNAELITPDPKPIAPIVIIHGRRRTEDAQQLVAQLQLLGIRARIDDGTRTATLVESTPIRLVALPGGRTAIDRITEFFARVGAKVAAGVAEVIFIARKDLTPVFGFAQSLALELPDLPILGIEVDPATQLAPLACAQVNPGVQLFRISTAGSCETPYLTPWQPAAPSPIPLQPKDILVVSGGAKGITAACTLALMQATHTRAMLLGTTTEETPGKEVTATLHRMAAAGLEAVYLRCDVTSQYAVHTAIQRGLVRLGAKIEDIKGLIHGAGINAPTPVTKLAPHILIREYAIKISGLHNLLTELGAANLTLCVALGSVIGVVGMRGNSGYALANESLAATLAELKHKFPNLQVACPAYSVWAEIGMGAKLGVVDTLTQNHISAIPAADGTHWFMECCSQRGVPIPLVIAGSMHGLATWRKLRGTAVVSGLPTLVDNRIAHEPGLLVVSQPQINPQRDRWLSDHAFRGTLLFATVQALNYVAASACLLAETGVVTSFKQVRITRPIIVAQQGETRLEVDVRRAEIGWVGSVGTPGTARAEPAFSMQCQVGILDPSLTLPGAVANPDAHWEPLASAVGTQQLYTWILFQGPVFQRIEQLDALDLADDVHRRGRFRVRRESSAVTAAVPDIYFLDAMLQTVQVLVPRDICLPTAIAEIVLYPAAWEAGITTVEAEILTRTATGYTTRVRAWNSTDAAPIAYFNGYQVHIVASHTTRPDAQALLAPLAHDQAAIAGWLAATGAGLDVVVAIGDLAPAASQATRREAAARQLAAQLGVDNYAINWNAEGVPILMGQPGYGISIAHDNNRLLTVGGMGRIGCDLQRVGHNRVWAELLPASRFPLWHKLTGILQDPDCAGALVWAIHEALLKVGAPTIGVELLEMLAGIPQFKLSSAGAISAGIVELVLEGTVGIAIVQLPQVAAPRITHYSRDLELTFKEAIPPLKSPTASIFCGWMGALREEAMTCIRHDLAHAFAAQAKGMVTNETRVRIAYPVQFNTALRSWVWLNQVLVANPSTFELGFQWAELNAAGMPTRIVAQGLQSLTWVNIGPGGQVGIESFPTFFANFIAERLPAAGAKPFVPPLGYLLHAADVNELPQWRQDTDGGNVWGSSRLLLPTDDTYSNFVGNVYFSHIIALAERTCHQALRQLDRGVSGFYATSLQLTHLGEAMPGDVLEALVHLSEVGTKSCTFLFTITNNSHGDSTIATGRIRYHRFTMPPALPTEPLPMPGWLLPAGNGLKT